MFVVFEGIDGSGKTTISNRVAEALAAKGLSVKHLRAGGEFASLVTQAIRELGRDARNFELTPDAEFLLYLVRDVQLLQQVLRPALTTHDVVIADRSYFTAQVLGQFGRHLDPQWLKSIVELTTHEFKPDLVFLVDVDPKLARARRKTEKLKTAKGKPPSRKGLAGVGLQYRLQAGYLNLAKQDPEHWAVLANDAVLETTIASATNLILAAQSQGVAVALQQFRSSSTSSLAAKPEIETPHAALEALLRWVDAHSTHEPHVAAYMMGGLWGEAVDLRREHIAPRAPEATLAAAAGLDDPFSWRLREQFVEVLPKFVAQTLNGFDTVHPRARALRAQLLRAAPEEVLQSSSARDDEESWALRERLFERYPNAVIAALGRLGGERAWSFREIWRKRVQEIDRDYETARIALKSVVGLDDERAWQWRNLTQKVAPIAALGSLRGLVDAESWRWRRRFLSYAPKMVMVTIHRMQHPSAWQMRQEVAADCKEAIDSISKLDDEEAWQLRYTYWDLWPSTVVKSLGTLADEPKGQALLLRQLAKYPGNISLLQHASAIFLGAHRAQSLLDEE